MDLTRRAVHDPAASGGPQAANRQSGASRRPALFCAVSLRPGGGLCARVAVGPVNAELVMTEDDGSAPAVEGAAQLGLLAAELPIRLTVAHGKPAAR